LKTLLAERALDILHDAHQELGNEPVSLRAPEFLAEVGEECKRRTATAGGELTRYAYRVATGRIAFSTKEGGEFGTFDLRARLRI